MTGRTEDCYFHALHMMIHESDWKLNNPESFGLDFEQAEINAVTTQFPNAKKDGCNFHWKQALRKKMIEFSMNTDQIAHLMQKIDLLTVIPKDEVEWKGIPYLHTMIEPDLANEDIEKLNKFWMYFEKFWLRPKILDMWNMVDKLDADIEAIARTSNCLERYNRHLNGIFSSRHPNLLAFAEKLEEEANRVVRRLENIRKGHEVAPQYGPVPFPVIPDDYNKFEAPPNCPSRGRAKKLSRKQY